MEVVAILEHEFKHAQSAVLAGVPDVEVGICRYLNKTWKKEEQAPRAGKENYYVIMNINSKGGTHGIDASLPAQTN